MRERWIESTDQELSSCLSTPPVLALVIRFFAFLFSLLASYHEPACRPATVTMWEHVRVHVSEVLCACVWKPEDIRLQMSFLGTRLSETRSLPGLKLTRWARWVEQRASGATCLHLTSSLIASMHQHAGFFSGDSEAWTQVLMLWRQALYQLS